MNKFLRSLLAQIKGEFPNAVIDEFYTGSVTEVSHKTVKVRLEDAYTQEEFEGEMELQRFKTHANEVGKIRPGTLFHVCLGQMKSGENFELIRLNKQVWTPEMIDRAHKRAEKLFAKLNEARLVQD